ncbi:MAG: methylenetetrahydrofolate reductase C-terminal domain-containing protein [Candidatus Neomarinimicrobiota bacterium]
MESDFVTYDKPPISYRERRFSRFLLFFEDLIKVPIFRCQHCGECILSSTGFVCSQRCPKRLRNGPCGGTRADGHCEVYPERWCIWYKIYMRSKFWGRIKLLYKINRIHNWNLERTSAWLNVFKKRIDAPVLFVCNDKEAEKLDDFKRQD